ncbi:hypothetical protein [Ciceribacter sp. L1K22]|uniref:hypothetical protein n=1 Tax=Ciceribacter sp. L1K22 TaxID=2820275 RepID=UPI001ABEE0F7|nr:hypothetical protein [Ciceribacter sp. L1K22]MBO3760023.1 hypothetical protein [Ciceribacter sp. L1K22]
MTKRVASAAAIVAVLTGCQGVQHSTPSGRPEVTIAAPAKEVKTAFVGTLTNFGYELKRDSDFQVVVERQIDNMMANVLLSSNYDPTVEARITATFLELGQATRVTTDMGVVRNGGSAFEAVTNVNNSGDSLGVQSLLMDIKSGFESGKSTSEVIAFASQRSIGQRAAEQLPKK